MYDDFVISLDHLETDSRRATICFVVANAMAKSGKQVIVILSRDSVRLSQLSYAESIHERDFVPLKELMTDFAKAGGRIFVCQRCFKRRWLSDASLSPGAVIVSTDVLVDLISGCDCTDIGLSIQDGSPNKISRKSDYSAIGDYRGEREQEKQQTLSELNPCLNNVLASM